MLAVAGFDELAVKRRKLMGELLLDRRSKMKIAERDPANAPVFEFPEKAGDFRFRIGLKRDEGIQADFREDSDLRQAVDVAKSLARGCRQGLVGFLEAFGKTDQPHLGQNPPGIPGKEIQKSRRDFPLGKKRDADPLFQEDGHGLKGALEDGGMGLETIRSGVDDDPWGKDFFAAELMLDAGGQVRIQQNFPSLWGFRVTAGIAVSAPE